MKVMREPLWAITYKSSLARDSYGGIHLFKTKKEAIDIAANKTLSDQGNRLNYGVKKVYLAVDPR